MHPQQFYNNFTIDFIVLRQQYSLTMKFRVLLFHLLHALASDSSEEMNSCELQDF